MSSCSWLFLLGEPVEGLWCLIPPSWLWCKRTVSCQSTLMLMWRMGNIGMQTGKPERHSWVFCEELAGLPLCPAFAFAHFQGYHVGSHFQVLSRSHSMELKVKYASQGCLWCSLCLLENSCHPVNLKICKVHAHSFTFGTTHIIVAKHAPVCRSGGVHSYASQCGHTHLYPTVSIDCRWPIYSKGCTNSFLCPAFRLLTWLLPDLALYCSPWLYPWLWFGLWFFTDLPTCHWSWLPLWLRYFYNSVLHNHRMPVLNASKISYSHLCVFL